MRNKAFPDIKQLDGFLFSTNSAPVHIISAVACHLLAKSPWTSPRRPVACSVPARDHFRGCRGRVPVDPLRSAGRSKLGQKRCQKAERCVSRSRSAIRTDVRNPTAIFRFIDSHSTFSEEKRGIERILDCLAERPRINKPLEEIDFAITGLSFEDSLQDCGVYNRGIDGLLHVFRPNLLRANFRQQNLFLACFPLDDTSCVFHGHHSIPTSQVGMSRGGRPGRNETYMNSAAGARRLRRAAIHPIFAQSPSIPPRRTPYRATSSSSTSSKIFISRPINFRSL